MTEQIKYPKGKHPNSLAALGRPWTPEEAKEAQLKGAKARSANAAARDALKASVKQWKTLKTEVLDDQQLSAVDVLKVLMHQALLKEDFDTAGELASKLAEFETPKLARQEVKIEESDTTTMSDAELNAKLKAFMKEDG